MIYDNIDCVMITEGEGKKFNEQEDKFLVPIYYKNSSLVFTFRNRYFTIAKIEENAFNKEYVAIHSAEFGVVVSNLCKKLNAVDPTQPDGSIRASIVAKTKIKFDGDVSELRNNSFNACISFNFPTVFDDGNKRTLQIHAKEIVVTKLLNDDLEIDYNKLVESK